MTGTSQDTSPYVVAVFNQKGGISKTTTSDNLAAALAAFGRRVLMIDLDSQGDTTKSLGVDHTGRIGVRNLLLGEKEVAEVLQPTPFEGISIIPSTYSLAGIEFEMSERQNSQRTLAAALSRPIGQNLP